MTRRLIGWRVRWESLVCGEWEPGAVGICASLHGAREFAEIHPLCATVRNVRIMRVHRRSKR